METHLPSPGGTAAVVGAAQASLWGDELLDPQAAQEPNLGDYDRIIVAFSGGKDGLAAILDLLDRGVEPSRIHLHHHLVDGDDSELMDWPVTEAYCKAVAKALGMEISFSFKVGGFEREMNRRDAPTAPCNVPCGTGRKLVGGSGPNGTREKFPQVSADLSVRFCSSYTKIGVFDAWVKNDPQFLLGKTLVITGERAQESPSRAKYKAFEPHRADNRCGRRVKRYVDHWRSVHAWTEEQVWAIIKRYRILPHVSYMMGFGRCSCRGCIFANKDQWATVKVIAPQQFKRIADYERQFGVTIHRTENVETRAAAGTPYPFDPKWIEIANSKEFTLPVFTDDWVLPLGAYGDSSCGPS